MSRTAKKTRKPYGCGPRYCWCCDAKKCDQHSHDPNGNVDLADGEREFRDLRYEGQCDE